MREALEYHDVTIVDKLHRLGKRHAFGRRNGSGCKPLSTVIQPQELVKLVDRAGATSEAAC